MILCNPEPQFLGLGSSAFATAPDLLLNLACIHNSPAHSSIGTSSTFNGLWHLVSIQFQILFTPLPGFFSPFPHGTGSLSVTEEYLALRSGLRSFRQGFTCPALLRILLRVHNISFTGLSPTTVYLSRYFNYIMNFLLLMRSPTTPIRRLVWAVPLSLATTKGIDFSFYSSGY